MFKTDLGFACFTQSVYEIQHVHRQRMKH